MENGRVSEKIANTIKQMVIDKDYLPGEKLPNERKLSEEMNVSRTALREALNNLDASGVVEIKRGAGTFISENPGVIDDPLGLEYISDKGHTLKHWYDVRLILEPESVYMATKEATEEEIKRIRELELIIREQVKNKEEFIEVDLEFHTELARATHNPIMERLIPLIYKSANIDDKTFQSNQWYERARANASESHIEIVKFLQKRDAQGARLAARYHLIRAIEDMNISKK